MIRSLMLTAFALVAAVAFTPAAHAQECPCNCYFSSDCEGGDFCNWGTLSQEDTCFWRTPKPQGVPGAGCTDEYGNWGQCDGICDGVAAVAIFKDERIGDIVGAIDAWSQAFDNAATAGGGHPDGDFVQQAAAIPFKEPRMIDSVWRVTVEVLTLTRGTDFFIFPEQEWFHSENVQVKDLSRDPDLVRLGNLAVRALMAEVQAPGAGLPHIRSIGDLGLDARLDTAMFTRFCDGESPLSCLYGKIADIGDAVGRGGRGDVMMASTGGPGCGGQDPLVCAADVDGNGLVAVDDLVIIITRWGPLTQPHAADVNGDLVVGVDDLVAVIEMWGGTCSQ